MKETEIDWGCPDGLNADDYQGHEQWTHLKWRWELVRRIQGYRLAFQFEMLDRHKAQYGSTPVDVIWLPEYKNAVINKSSLCRRYGLPICPNPLYSQAIDPFLDEPPEHYFRLRSLSLWHFEALKTGKLNTDDLLLHGEEVIVFNLARPIKDQIEGLEKYLEGRRSYQKQKGYVQPQPDKWISYLRTLDARAAGHSWRVCAENIATPEVVPSVDTARSYFAAGLRLQAVL